MEVQALEAEAPITRRAYACWCASLEAGARVGTGAQEREGAPKRPSRQMLAGKGRRDTVGSPNGLAQRTKKTPGANMQVALSGAATARKPNGMLVVRLARFALVTVLVMES